MNKEINPAALVGIIVVLVGLIAVFGYRVMQPARYTPSPGVVGNSGTKPGAVQGAAIPSAPLATPMSTPSSYAGSSSGTRSGTPKPTTYFPAPSADIVPGKPVSDNAH